MSASRPVAGAGAAAEGAFSRGEAGGDAAVRPGAGAGAGGSSVAEVACSIGGPTGACTTLGPATGAPHPRTSARRTAIDTPRRSARNIARVPVMHAHELLNGDERG